MSIRHYAPVYDYRDPACPAGWDPEEEQDAFDRRMEERFEAERERA